MELNALERFIEDKENLHLSDNLVPICDNALVSGRVRFYQLRAFAEEHRELEQRFKERGDRLFESGKMIVIREERCKELEAQLAQREGERCTNCVHGRPWGKSQRFSECCYMWDEHMEKGDHNTVPQQLRCQHYEAKPKVRRCWGNDETTN